MRFNPAIRLFLLLVSALPALQAETAAAWRPLLDPTLSAWDTYIGVPHGSVNLPGVKPEWDGMRKGTALGLNNDPLKVFSVVMEGGEPVLQISGQIYGALSSKAEYSDYHLRVQFKWGEKKWAPRLDKQRDNGILYHCTGPHGAFWNVWKRCLEYQVQEKDMGDFYGLAGVSTEIPAVQDGKRWFYTVGGAVKKFRPGAEFSGTSAAHLKGDFEKPHGEWNILEIFTLGRNSVHVVNGQVVMVLRNNAVIVEGKELPLTAGQIQIQSEGAEAYYRRIELRPITELPADIRKAAGL